MNDRDAMMIALMSVVLLVVLLFAVMEAGNIADLQRRMTAMDGGPTPP